MKSICPLMKFLWYLILFPILRAAQVDIMPDPVKTKEWCFAMRNRYNIVPGETFGNLPKEYHNQYLSSKCDHFFCKPHKGKGKFNCETLE